MSPAQLWCGHAKAPMPSRGGVELQILAGCRYKNVSAHYDIVYHYNDYLQRIYLLLNILTALSALDEVVASTSTSASLPSLATHTPKSSSLLKVGLYY